MEMLYSLLKHRIITLDKSISTESANPLIAQLLLLDAEDQKAPIHLYINSPGGSVLDGLAVIDTMQCIEAPVFTVCLGRAASMAAWILAAGARNHPLVSPHAEIMIHGLSEGMFAEDGLGLRMGPPVQAAGFRTRSADREIYFRRQENWQQRLVTLLAAWTGQAPERIESHIHKDFFLSAAEAKAYGLVDNILEPFKGTSGR